MTEAHRRLALSPPWPKLKPPAPLHRIALLVPPGGRLAPLLARLLAAAPHLQPAELRLPPSSLPSLPPATPARPACSTRCASLPAFRSRKSCEVCPSPPPLHFHLGISSRSKFSPPSPPRDPSRTNQQPHQLPAQPGASSSLAPGRVRLPAAVIAPAHRSQQLQPQVLCFFPAGVRGRNLLVHDHLTSPDSSCGLLRSKPRTRPRSSSPGSAQLRPPSPFPRHRRSRHVQRRLVPALQRATAYVDLLLALKVACVGPAKPTPEASYPELPASSRLPSLLPKSATSERSSPCVELLLCSRRSVSSPSPCAGDPRPGAPSRQAPVAPSPSSFPSFMFL
nr:proline-rich protein 36-like [Aegilops tauschii subsp. strangulata]